MHVYETQNVVNQFKWSFFIEAGLDGSGKIRKFLIFPTGTLFLAQKIRSLARINYFSDTSTSLFFGSTLTEPKYVIYNVLWLSYLDILSWRHSKVIGALFLSHF